jgi:hypothetical protein
MAKTRPAVDRNQEKKLRKQLQRAEENHLKAQQQLEASQGRLMKAQMRLERRQGALDEARQAVEALAPAGMMRPLPAPRRDGAGSGLIIPAGASAPLSDSGDTGPATAAAGGGEKAARPRRSRRKDQGAAASEETTPAPPAQLIPGTASEMPTADDRRADEPATSLGVVVP